MEAGIEGFKRLCHREIRIDASRRTPPNNGMFEPGEYENEQADDWVPGSEVTRELFLKWRDARRGAFPGEDLTNPVWLWLTDSNISAYTGNDHFKGPSSYGGNAGWSFNRFGRSLTELPDGTRIMIAGEHEDHYDPDFFIYNDVIIAHPNGRIEIHGYPEDHFPPTDFHSATLVGGELVLIGNLSYPHLRRFGETQVFAYEIGTKRFRRIETSGDAPGWIASHQASPDGRNGIIVKGGKIDHGEDHGGYLENFNSWRLDLNDWKWERLTHQPVGRWKFVREDGDACQLFPKRMSRMGALVGLKVGKDEIPEFDGELLDRLYDPLVPHEALADHDWSERTRFVIDGVPVHFEEGMYSVLLTVVGELPSDMMCYYVGEVRDRLSSLEGVAYRVEKL